MFETFFHFLFSHFHIFLLSHFYLGVPREAIRRVESFFLTRYNSAGADSRCNRLQCKVTTLRRQSQINPQNKHAPRISCILAFMHSCTHCVQMSNRISNNNIYIIIRASRSNMYTTFARLQDCKIVRFLCY